MGSVFTLEEYNGFFTKYEHFTCILKYQKLPVSFKLAAPVQKKTQTNNMSLSILFGSGRGLGTNKNTYIEANVQYGRPINSQC